MYFVSFHYVNKFLNDFLPPGSTRRLIAFLFASFISWLIGAGIDLLFPSQAINLF
jgi:hypothetical protein